MNLLDMMKKLSYGELSNLSMSNSGSGTIRDAEIPKLVGYIGEGLTRLYSRFMLSTKELIIEQVEGITNYHLITKHAETNPSLLYEPYIKDIPDAPFTGDVIRVLEVYDHDGSKFPLNDIDHSESLFTPAPLILQVPKPVPNVMIAVIYQARHPVFVTNQLDQTVDVPFVLEEALTAFVAHKVFSHMNGQDNMAKSQELLATYEFVCAEVEQKDLVNNTFATSFAKLDVRGFV